LSIQHGLLLCGENSKKLRGELAEKIWFSSFSLPLFYENKRRIFHNEIWRFVFTIYRIIEDGKGGKKKKMEVI